MSIAISILIVTCMSIALLGVLRGLGLSGNLSVLIAGVPLACIQWVHQFVENRLRKKNRLRVHDTIESIAHFGIHPHIMVVFVVLTFLGLHFLISTVATFIPWASGFGKPLAAGHIPYLRIAAILAGAGNLVIAYMVGYWIGSRCRKHRFKVLLISFIAVVLIFNIVEHTVVPDPIYESIHMQKASRQFFLLKIVGTLIWFVGAGALGLWWGHRSRNAHYLKFLLGRLPHETQYTLLEIAQEETQRLVNTVPLTDNQVHKVDRPTENTT